MLKCPDRYTTSSTKKQAASSQNSTHRIFSQAFVEVSGAVAAELLGEKGDYDALDNLETLTVTRLIDAGIATYLASFRAALVSL